MFHIVGFLSNRDILYRLKFDIFIESYAFCNTTWTHWGKNILLLGREMEIA